MNDWINNLFMLQTYQNFFLHLKAVIWTLLYASNLVELEKKEKEEWYIYY